jgi:hypothetical protein
MRIVFQHVYEACKRNRIPIGAAPNIEVSLVCQPDDTRYLARPGLSTWLYERWLGLARGAAKPVFARKLRPRPAPASAPPAPAAC